MGTFLMPSLGADMEDGQLVEWVKHPGDAVARGDVVAVVETQKGAIEIEAFEDGTLESILVDCGRSVPVGTPLAMIRTHEGVGAPAHDPPVELDTEIRTALVERDRDRPSKRKVRPRVASSSARRSISPAARRRAKAVGLDPQGLSGSGPGGAIVLADIEAALQEAALGSGAPCVAPPVARDAAASGSSLPDGMRNAIGAAMTRSKREIPHYYLAHSADLTVTTDWLARRNADRLPDQRVPMAALYIAAVARSARRHPRFNGHWTDGAFHPGSGVHVGMAIRLRGAAGGLVAPALHDADREDPEALAARLVDLVDRVRAGRFRSAELADPTLTVSSVGERGVQTLYGVIHPPQVCLVGIGAPHIVPRVRDGAVVPAPVVSLTLAADHRVTDGHAGSRFLTDIARRLEDPDTLFGMPAGGGH